MWGDKRWAGFFPDVFNQSLVITTYGDGYLREKYTTSSIPSPFESVAVDTDNAVSILNQEKKGPDLIGVSELRRNRTKARFCNATMILKRRPNY